MKKALAALLLSALSWFGAVAGLILLEEPAPGPHRGDVAIILGAAVRADGSPSPVFEGRLEQGVALYRQGRVRKLLFTGGSGEGQPLSEATVGARYAISRGIPPSEILIEQSSRTTQQNLAEAKRLMTDAGLGRALLVSDPLHLPRALRIARAAGIIASPSPTPTSRYRSLRTRLPFLSRESFFLTGFWLTGR